MKAYTSYEYGPPEVLTLIEKEKPVPAEDEILVRVKATTVNAADCNIRGLSQLPPGLKLMAKSMLGWKKPKIEIHGTVMAGEVELTGVNVKSFKPGDRIYGTGAESGAYAEYALVKEKSAVSLIPSNLSFEEAATVPYGALTAYWFLKNKANVGKGHKVLIAGASGGVGSYAVQIAKHFGAEVTGICSTANVNFVRALGADTVIDYKQENIFASAHKWDIIFDVVKGVGSFRQYKKLINKKGFYLAVAGGMGDMLSMVKTTLTGGKKVIFGGGTSVEIKENLDYLSELLSKGELKPTLDKTFGFNEMTEAHRYVEEGSKKGNIAVRV